MYCCEDASGNISCIMVQDTAHCDGKSRVEYDGTRQASYRTQLKWARIRAHRDGLLDWSQGAVGSDSPFTAGEVSGWQTWRQTLRDLPSTYAADPDTAVWPTTPYLWKGIAAGTALVADLSEVV